MEKPSNKPPAPVNSYKVIGLMSGTSLDGIDLALLETDGASYVKPLASGYTPYADEIRTRIRACFGFTAPSLFTDLLEQDLTQLHADCVNAFIMQHNLNKQDIALLGFHGQTITHKPDEKMTWQLGDGELLARTTGIDTAYDFRTADVLAGGQGAPLLPLYHQAIYKMLGINKPIAFLNIGGVSNITYCCGDDILAFDSGPGNALMDDILLKATGKKYDVDGIMAATGKSHTDIVESWMHNPFFHKLPPKSLDRNAWDITAIESLAVEDAVSTLNDFTASANAAALRACPQMPEIVYVTGGGRHNLTLLKRMARKTNTIITAIEDIGFNGDTLEAEGFAYLALRVAKALPLSLPTTTGVPAPQKGGKIAKAL